MFDDIQNGDYSSVSTGNTGGTAARLHLAAMEWLQRERLCLKSLFPVHQSLTCVLGGPAST